MPSFVRALVPFASSLFVLAVTIDAGAVAAPEPSSSCEVTGIRGNGTKIRLPSNAPALPLADRSRNATARVVPLAVGTVTFDVVQDLLAPGYLSLVPSGPLPVGAHTLEWMTTCSASSAASPPGSTTLDVVEGAALPTSIGTVTSGEELRLDVAPELAPWQDVTAFSVRVRGGVTLFGSAYGNLRSSTKTLVVRAPADLGHVETGEGVVSHPLVRFATDGTCDDREGVVDVPIEISAHVAGAGADPSPASGSLRVDCGAARRIEAEIEAAEGGGCIMHGHGRSSDAGWVGALVGALVVALRRRRR